jgi:DNA-binding LacI/PurR family transcriptional regulator
MPLTSVGDEAVRALLHQLNTNEDFEYEGTELETRLLVRDSIGKAK